MKYFYLILILLLTGCVGKPTSQPSAWLKPGVKVMLPTPSLNEPINEQQLLTAEIKGQTHSLIVLLDVDDQQLTLAGLSSIGIRLFLLKYDQQGLHTEQSIILPEMPPAEQVLADIMLSYWPIQRWQPLLPTGWVLIDNGLTRELRDNNQQLIYSIKYEMVSINDPMAGTHIKRVPIQVNNHYFEYKIHIARLGDT